jgi:hypothetical protein
MSPIYMPQDAQEKVCRTGSGRDDESATTNRKTSIRVQLEISESYDHSVCRKTCIRQGAWLIASGWELRHHVCYIVCLQFPNR